jgi:tetratricopeptide (TPR) repeat protein
MIAVSIAGMAFAGPALAQSREEADALYAESKWQEAAQAYQAVVDGAQDDSAAWFGLAQAQHQLAEYEAAVNAYRKALDAGFQPPMRVHYHLARAYMSLGDTEQALEQIEAIAAIGGISHRVLLAVTELEPLNDNPRYLAIIEQLTPCNTPRYRDFDFWLGEWDVTPANAPTSTAHNSITSVQDGCVVLEQYETQGGFTGMSINFYDSVTGLWHQTWMSNSGGAVYLEGGLRDGAMVLTDADLPISDVAGTINRVTWSTLDDGRVRQHWENSTDQGETWTTSFDGYYARSEPNE